jgi:hypothetical protein
MSETGSRRAVRLFLSACVVLCFSCSHGSPTEPMANRVNLKLVITPGLISSDESAVLVQSDTCSCTKVPVTVSVNGTMAGTVGCGETKSLPVASGTHTFNILVTSPEINGNTASVTFGGSLSGGSFQLPITLTCSPR